MSGRRIRRGANSSQAPVYFGRQATFHTLTLAEPITKLYRIVPAHVINRVGRAFDIAEIVTHHL